MQEPLEGGDVVVPLRGSLHGLDDSPVEDPQQDQREYAWNKLLLEDVSHTIYTHMRCYCYKMRRSL